MPYVKPALIPSPKLVYMKPTITTVASKSGADVVIPHVGGSWVKR